MQTSHPTVISVTPVKQKHLRMSLFCCLGVKGRWLFIRILQRFAFGLVEAWFISGGSNSQ